MNNLSRDNKKKSFKDETSAVYGIPIAIIVSILGMISNIILISFLMRRVKHSLGNKFLLCLNILDLTVCLLTIVAMFVLLASGSKNMSKVNYSIQEFYSMLVELSGITTCFLCGLRMVAILFPFHVIRKIRVFLSFGLLSLYILLRKTIMTFSKSDWTRQSYQRDAEGLISLTLTISVVEVAIMVVFVTVCSVICALKLINFSDGNIITNQDKDTNKKATVMVLILCALFVLLNTIWCIMMFVAMTVDKRDDLALVKMATYLPMTVNSSFNPLVYFSRNREIRKYVTRLMKVFGCTGCRNLAVSNTNIICRNNNSVQFKATLE